MRVLVCGGRDYKNKGHVYAVLDALGSVDLLIHGALGRGADSLASQWATDRGIPQEAHPADWKTYGKKAGPIRNYKMLVVGSPDLVVAFPGGKGTAHMCEIARAEGITVKTNLEIMELFYEELYKQAFNRADSEEGIPW